MIRRHESLINAVPQTRKKKKDDIIGKICRSGMIYLFMFGDDITLEGTP